MSEAITEAELKAMQEIHSKINISSPVLCYPLNGKETKFLLDMIIKAMQISYEAVEENKRLQAIQIEYQNWVSDFSRTATKDITDLKAAINKQIPHNKPTDKNPQNSTIKGVNDNDQKSSKRRK